MNLQPTLYCHSAKILHVELGYSILVHQRRPFFGDATGQVKHCPWRLQWYVRRKAALICEISSNYGTCWSTGLTSSNQDMIWYNCTQATYVSWRMFLLHMFTASPEFYMKPKRSKSSYRLHEYHKFGPQNASCRSCTLPFRQFRELPLNTSMMAILGVHVP